MMTAGTRLPSLNTEPFVAEQVVTAEILEIAPSKASAQLNFLLDEAIFSPVTLRRRSLMTRPVSDIAFTPTVKALQVQHGSRDAYARMEQGRGWQQTVTPDLAAFIAERDSFYLGTANAEGQPYIQHWGGPKGFLKVIDDRTLAFADFRGNKQYITAGALTENDKAFIFLMDYASSS
jgi:hypothetical protein